MPQSEYENALGAVRFSPASTVLVYIIVVIALIPAVNIASAWLVQYLSVSEISVLKGFLFVIASSAGLYFLVRHLLRQSSSSQEIFQATFIEAPDAICINRLNDLSVLRANDRFTRIFGFPEAGTNDSSLQPATLWNFVDDLARFRKHLDEFREVNEFDTVLRTNSGALLSVVLSARIVELDGEACVVINIHDISRVVQAEEEAKKLAHYDQETGLPNHNMLLDRLNQIIALDTRERRSTAIIYITLSGFKSIVDYVGHEGGKAVIRTIARQLTGLLRQIDTVARVNREDFVIVLGGKVQEANFSLILHKLQNLFEHPVILPQGNMMLMAAFGVACFPSDGLSADILLKNAHFAMTQARNSETGGFRFFSDTFNSMVLERRRIENDMKTGLASGDFFLCYQPKFTSSGREIVGMEALVRWNQAGSGLMMPDRFIPIAEETGFIVKLGQWILEEACRQNRKWHDEGLCQLRVSVNISVRQLHDNEFIDCVSEILELTGLQPELLELELTESVIMSEPDDSIMKLLRLKEMGVTLAVDDFGTGYSSLSYLKHLPIDILKIDRSFVTDIGNDPEDEAIIGAIISLAHSLKLKVIAEGVETRQQLDFLEKKHCDEVQGYLFAKPLTPDQFELFLRGGAHAVGMETSRGDFVETVAHLEQPDSLQSVAVVKSDKYITVPTTGYDFIGVNEYIGDLLVPVDPVIPSATLPHVLNRFQVDSSLLILPVVDNGNVVGMVSRLSFLEDHVIGRHGFGFHINYSRKIRELMSPPEIIIEAGTRIDEAAYNIQALKAGARIENVCITRNGMYAGLLDVNRFVSAMTERNLTLAKGANPLTGLPGNESIQRVINEKIIGGQFFDIAYVDIDNFKPYNDCYGFQKGDIVIKALGGIICGAGSCREPEGKCFCGHIGGDDFILISDSKASKSLAEDIIREFEKQLPVFHGTEDFAAGCYHSVNRKGEYETFPLLSISIGIINTMETPVNSYALLASLSAEIKKAAKKLSGSSVVVNRRIIDDKYSGVF